MATRTTVVVTDDFDGSADAETVTFSVNGQNYEIDLSEPNRQKFTKAVQKYVDAGRKVSANGRGPGRRPRTTSTRRRSGEVRAWAKARGYKVSERGRVPASIVAEFEADQG